MLNLFLFIASASAASPTFENCRLVVQTSHGGEVAKTESQPLQKIGDEDGVVTYRTFVAGYYAYFIHASGGPLVFEHAPTAANIAKRNFPSSYYVAAVVDYLGRGNYTDLKDGAEEFSVFRQERVASDSAMYRFLLRDGARTLAQSERTSRYTQGGFLPYDSRKATLTCQ